MSAASAAGVPRVAGDAGSVAPPGVRNVSKAVAEAKAEQEREDAKTGVQILPVDRVLGRYRLCFEIASGGMASVYLARAEGPAGFGKVFAVKQIHPHLAKERQFQEMFMDEARLAARLNHPNVCGVIDFGEVDGSYYITMEYLMGETLAAIQRRVARRSADLPVDDYVGYACKIIHDVAEGLHSAHELKDNEGNPMELIHRDISPQNLYVTYDGGVRVVDFGVARARSRTHHTKTGSIKGKFSYMAPEQIRGESIDRRVDVWALGVTLWETLCLRRLFRRESEGSTILAVIEGSVPSVSEFNSAVPPEVEAIVMKALARDPDARYPTVREMGRDLARFLGKRPDPIGAGELAEWMQSLFVDNIVEKRALVQQALKPTRAGSILSRDLTSLPPVGQSQAQLKVPAQLRSLSWVLAVLALLGLAGGGWALFSAPAASSGATPVIDDQGGSWEPASDGREGLGTPAGAGADADKLRARPGNTLNKPDLSFTTEEVAALLAKGSASESEQDATAGDSTADPVPNAPQGRSAGQRAAAQRAAAQRAEAERIKAEEEAKAAAAREAKQKAEQEAAARAAQAEAERRKAQAARQAKAAEAPGWLSLATPGGWADIIVSGTSVGQTPKRFQLAPGDHIILLRPFGEGPEKRLSISIKPGESLTRSVSLR